MLLLLVFFQEISNLVVRNDLVVRILLGNKRKKRRKVVSFDILIRFQVLEEGFRVYCWIAFCKLEIQEKKRIEKQRNIRKKGFERKEERSREDMKRMREIIGKEKKREVEERIKEIEVEERKRDKTERNK